MRIKLSDIGNPRVNLLRIAAKAFLDGIGFLVHGWAITANTSLPDLANSA